MCLPYVTFIKNDEIWFVTSYLESEFDVPRVPPGTEKVLCNIEAEVHEIEGKTGGNREHRTPKGGETYAGS